MERTASNKGGRRWFMLLVKPAIVLACGGLLLFALGLVQRTGLLQSAKPKSDSSANAESKRYICPMMCTPPQAQPGRCPVCAMELVPATSGDSNDPRGISITPAARRVADIQTAPVELAAITRKIRAIGAIGFNEGALKTISAYVNGRLDKLYADYTGVEVRKGDPLALLYSPILYSSQTELLLAKTGRDKISPTASADSARFDSDLYSSAKERLKLFGMADEQIERLEQAGKPSSHLQLIAPISGTVTEKLAVEGQYVKEGDPIYRLADLSTVWLMLRLFPEDAASIHYGQKVVATVHSLPGRKFSGRVAFIDPVIDPKTRTIGIRVVIPNQEGLLRIGDYAKATIQVSASASQDAKRYDPDLANKWISPHHPHIISDSPGACPVCGVKLVPSSEYGFSGKPVEDDKVLVVPRDAVLMGGDTSVVYVETSPSRFEMRPVVLGPVCDDRIVIREGLTPNESVATRGNFLIDSQMQLAGKPSLIDPTKVSPTAVPKEDKVQDAALADLSDKDRLLAELQKTCPVTGMALGSMGTPKKVNVNGKPLFICCEGCRKPLLANPAKYIGKPPPTANQGLPPIEAPRLSAPSIALPPISTPQAFSTPEELDAKKEAADDQ